MLIVENGTKPEGANSYVTLAEADAYLAPRSLWDISAPDAERERALLRACDFLNTLPWKGQLPNWQRVMAWPRINVPLPTGNGLLPLGSIPNAVRYAQMELAALFFAGVDVLAPMERGGKVKTKSESRTGAKIDLLQEESTATSITFADDAPVADYLPAVYGILAPWLVAVPGVSASAFAGELEKG